jgi:hypothetical protein
MSEDAHESGLSEHIREFLDVSSRTNNYNTCVGFGAMCDAEGNHNTSVYNCKIGDPDGELARNWAIAMENRTVGHVPEREANPNIRYGAANPAPIREPIVKPARKWWQFWRRQ